jgi:CheY-like chemotaxis protein
MHALGGRLDLRSVPGEGTRATLILPLGAERPHAVAPPARESGTRLAGRAPQNHKKLVSQGPCRVLIADDHVMVRQGLRSVLESFTDIVVIGEAANGEEAVALSEQLKPAAVVMDINMPVMNGIEATARIKTRHPDVVVIGLSVNASGENQDAMRTAGATSLLTKEAAVEQLYGAIQGALKGTETPKTWR